MRDLPKIATPTSVQQARSIQDELRSKLNLADDFSKVETIAGIDVGYNNEKGLAHASVVVLLACNLELKEHIQLYMPIDFPYIPGLLAFRELPAILKALSQLKTTPDLLMVDGHGIAHPKRMGIAAHLGVILDMPAIGVAKSRLTGRFDMPGPNKGDQSPLMSGKEQIGVVLRSRDKVNPLFISPGHRISIETAVAFTLACLTRYRLPEPTRLADKFSKCPAKA